MKRLLLLALCALFALNAGARTLYVDAKRPNNKGNALSAKKAKKTLQAAINVARKGDTILVRPGKYKEIRTNNKKITIKSVNGVGETLIKVSDSNTFDYVADLAAWKESGRQTDVGWIPNLLSLRGGKATKLVGFELSADESLNYPGGAIAGGTVSKCKISFLGRGDAYFTYMVRHSYARKSSGKSTNTWAVPTFDHANLTDCTIHSCDPAAYVASDPASGIGICQSKLVRCQIRACNAYNVPFRIHDSDFRNCLIAETPRIAADNSSFVNCTVVRNAAFKATKSKFLNCILYRSGSKAFKKTAKNKFSKTFKDNRDPRFVSVSNGEYRLSVGSPCIDTGKTVSGMGSKDLGRDRRVRGKSVDRGCFEYHGGQELEVQFFVGRDYFGELGGGYQYGTYEYNREYGYLPNLTKAYSASACYGVLPSPKKKNRIFAGWWTDPVAGKQVFPTSPVSCFRLFAHWIALDVVDESGLTVAPIFSYDAKRDKYLRQTIGLVSLKVPEKLDGKPITELWGDYGYAITDVTFPPTFTAINDFRGWTNLTRITIPNSVSSIAFDAFLDCPALKAIRLQNGSPLVPGVDFWIPDGCKVVRY